ncbi:DUF4345 domain-containing protein [Streptomyces sp. NPDC048387]|uniref:DUF4345 domain-containing protein n=1 Tax=unclassified Streptomyces TaxID=2593676 RepID=UPI0036C75917
MALVRPLRLPVAAGVGRLAPAAARRPVGGRVLGEQGAQGAHRGADTGVPQLGAGAGRFLGAFFAGYGLARVWAARQDPVPARLVRGLAAVFALGTVGRLLSLAVEGRPHWFQVVLIVQEVLIPPLLFWLADADERAYAARRGGEGAI